MGVWIETQKATNRPHIITVTPLVGVWIETLTNKRVDSYDTSHPSWVCGLKLRLLIGSMIINVTPLVGVWIETSFQHVWLALF